jgi:hypothetical protein
VFPRTSWLMNMQEVLTAVDLTKEDTSNYIENTFFRIKDYKLFGEIAKEVSFYFYNSKLYQIEAIYPDDVNMDIVLKNMKKSYGSTVSKISIFDYFLINDTLNFDECVQTEHLKLWSLQKSIIDSIPVNEVEEYRRLWQQYLSPLKEDESWNKFSNDGSLVSIAWTDNNEIPVMSKYKNRLFFDGGNYLIYNEIKNQLSLAP